MTDLPTDRDISKLLRRLRRSHRTPWHTRALINVLARHWSFDRKLVGAELGVEEGKSTETILYCYRQARMHAIDCWTRGGHTSVWTQQQHDNNLVQTLLRIRPYRDRVQLWVMSTLEAAERIENASLDFVFLDANHEYEAVKTDLNAYWPKLRDGGILIGHDYGGSGDGTGRFGVKPAVDEFCEQHSVGGFDRDYNLYWFPKHE